MHTVVRHYKGASALIDELGRRSADLETLIRGVPGFVAYYLVKTADGGYSVSVFEDRSGTEESNRRAAEYLKTNLSSIATSPPEILQGEAIIDFARYSTT
jgi:predicted amino acid dehydrogenase